MSRDNPNRDEFERLFVNNRDFARLQAYLDRFNIFSVMRTSRMEIRHSNVLAWLLRPNESHGLRDRFLRAFLSHVRLGKEDPGSLDIVRADLRDVTVRREWRNIDILAISPSNGWAFIIENKVDSKKRREQLTKYKEDVEKIYGSIKLCYVLLRLQDDDDPKDEAYIPLSYEWVRSTLTDFLDTFQELPKDVVIFIKHYIITLGELLGMNAEETKIEEVARQLYIEHRRVLDFIQAHAQSELAIAADQVFADGAIGEQVRKHGVIGFVPKAWKEPLRSESIAWRGCENWFAGLPLACFFQLRATGDDGNHGKLALVAEVGPLADGTLRVELIDAVEGTVSDQNKVKFGKHARTESRSFSRFLRKASKNVDDRFDPKELQEGMEALLQEWSGVFEKIAQALPEFVRRAKRQGDGQR